MSRGSDLESGCVNRHRSGRGGSPLNGVHDDDILATMMEQRDGSRKPCGTCAYNKHGCSLWEHVCKTIGGEAQGVRKPEMDSLKSGDHMISDYKISNLRSSFFHAIVLGIRLCQWTSLGMATPTSFSVKLLQLYLPLQGRSLRYRFSLCC